MIDPGPHFPYPHPMKTLTVTLKDEGAFLRAAQIAKQQNTSVEELISGILVSLTDDSAANGVAANRSHALSDLQSSFKTLSRPLGGKGYSSRDELYER